MTDQTKRLIDFVNANPNQARAITMKAIKRAERKTCEQERDQARAELGRLRTALAAFIASTERAYRAGTSALDPDQVLHELSCILGDDDAWDALETEQLHRDELAAMAPHEDA